MILRKLANCIRLMEITRGIIPTEYKFSITFDLQKPGGKQIYAFCLKLRDRLRYTCDTLRAEKQITSRDVKVPEEK